MEKATAKSQRDMSTEPLTGILEEELTTSLVNGQLPCAVAFKIAEKSKVSIGEVGKAADKLGIRIVKCQLGCFP